jgi:hypothetical protein
MENLIKFIKIDIVVQKILFFVVCITGIVVFPLMITLPVLGGWQLLSAGIIWNRLKNEIRKKYLRYSISYLGLMFLSFFLANYFQSGLFGFMVALIFIPIPFCIAIWYYLETKSTLQELEKKGIVEIPEVMSDILDSEEIFKIEEKL